MISGVDLAALNSDTVQCEMPIFENATVWGDSGESGTIPVGQSREQSCTNCVRPCNRNTLH